MIRSLFALLLLVTALSGGSYALFGSRSRKRKRAVNDAVSAEIRRYERYLSNPTPRSSQPAQPHRVPTFLDVHSGSKPHQSSASSMGEVGPLVLTSRIGAVVVAAVVFGTAAYLGLGGSIEAEAGNPSPTTNTTLLNLSAGSSLVDELRETREQIGPVAVLPAPATQVPAEAIAGEAAPAPEPEPAPVAEEAAPPPAPVIQVPSGGIEDIICGLPWPCGEAIAVARCESGTDRDGRLDGNYATNGNHYGLFQISGIHAWKWADFWDAWMDPARNAQYAYDIWSQSGWSPWSCKPWF